MASGEASGGHALTPGLFVCRITQITARWDSTELGGRTGNGPGKIPLHLADDLDPEVDPGVALQFRVPGQWLRFSSMTMDWIISHSLLTVTPIN